jgi:predicted RNase H-like HicB family nuclease
MARPTFIAILHKEGDIHVTDCPEVGTASQRYTIEEALRNLKEATELYLVDFPLPANGQPLVTTFEANYTDA